MATQQQKRKAAAQTGLYLLIVAAILVVGNIISAGVYERVDVTKAERHTLSEGSKRLIRSLNAPIQVDAYVKRGLPELDVFVEDLTMLLKQYERAAPDKFDFTLIEPNTDELRERAKEAGLQEIPFATATGEDQAAIAQGYMGLVFKYGSEKGVIPQIGPQFATGLEFWITNKIREVRDKADDIKHRIGVVTGKEELKLTDQNLVPRQGRQGSPSIQQILQQSFPFYKIEDVEIKEGEEIDPELVGLILTQPQKDYTETELRRIDEFLMRGGKSLAVFASAVTLKPQDPSMEATLSTHGLDKLLAGYGIDMKKNAVLDFGAQFRVPVMTPGGGVAWITHPGIARVVNDPRFDEEERPLDASFAGFFRMEELAFPFPSSLELLPNKQPKGVELKAIAKTSENAAVVTSDTVDMKMKEEWAPKPPFEQRTIAAVAKGKLKSAFAGSPSDKVKANERAPQESRVLVISSSLFLTNPFAYAGNPAEMGGQFQMFGGMGGDPQLQMYAQPYAQNFLTSTILSFKNTLDWMSGDSDLLAASAKIIGEQSLTYSSLEPPEITAEDTEDTVRKKEETYRSARKDLQKKVQFSLILGVPLLFGLFGVGRWRYRESKKHARRA